MKPITRIELYLAKLKGENATIPEPITRVEYYLAYLCGENVVLPEPITRLEVYLAYLCGIEIDLPEPITRIEKYLYAIAGMGDKPEKWITRVEYYLDGIELTPQGEAVTITGVSPLLLAAALEKEITALIQSGKVTQASTPSGSNVPIVCNNGELRMVDDELPVGYKRITGIEFDSSVYYQITDFYLKGSDTIRISFSVEKACNVFGCYTTTTATNNYSLYASTASGAKYLRYAGGTYKSQFASSTFGQRFDVVITPTGSSGMPSGQNDTWSESDFTATSALCIAHTSPSGTSSKLDGNIYGNIVVDGRLKLIPCIRISDSEIGYYDTYTDTFYAPVTGTPVSLGYDPSHLTLSVVGTPEVITLGEQTASAVNLFAVGDYADEQEIISGAVERKIGIKVFDGTEDWTYSSSRFRLSVPDRVISKTGLWCTHFGYSVETSNNMPDISVAMANASDTIFFRRDNITSLEGWTTYLAAQYAAGTPVIVIYPLATPTTEQTDPQTLSTAKGDNVLSVTANVDNIPLEVTYTKQN